MPTYVALLRGIDVGGRNPVAMSVLTECFRAAGYGNVRTHLQSGNVLFSSAEVNSSDLEGVLDELLLRRFEVSIPTVVRSRDELANTISSAPAGHGSAALRSEVFYLKRPLTVDSVMKLMPELRDGVDRVASGTEAVYFSRVTARATKTRNSTFMSMPIFRQMTVRTWRTSTRLLQLFHE